MQVNKLASEVNLECMLDSVQAEWSSCLSSIILALVVALGRNQPITEQLSPQHVPVTRASSPKSSTSRLQNTQINVQCSNINLYVCNEIKGKYADHQRVSHHSKGLQYWSQRAAQ